MDAPDSMLHDPEFWALGPRPAPQDIATELARTMEAGRFVRRDTTYVQTVYTVALSEHDLARFDGRKRELVATLKDTLAWWAREQGYTVPGQLRVRLIADDQLEAGQLTVEAGLRREEAAKLGRIRSGTE
ncbi:MAG TPA: FhaA domain-containing protein [Actinomycetota bacterium]|nr:FhaA domain-containing protein [Actinomycetota bacterium]